MVKAGGVGRGLTRDQIVRAAFEVLDDAGLEGITMRKVADRLGVQAAALYWHVSNKSDLLDEMGTSLWREVAPVAFTLPDGDLSTGLLRAARQLRRTLLEHRDGATVFAGRRLTDPEVVREQEAPIAALVAAGHDLAHTLQTWQIVLHFTVGWTAEEQGIRQAQEADPSSYDLELRDAAIDAEQHPHMAAAGRLMFTDLEARFEAALSRLVASLALT